MDLSGRTLTWLHQFMAPAVKTGRRTFVSFAFLTSIGFIWTFVLRGFISELLNETFVNVAFSLYTPALVIVFCAGCFQLYKWVLCCLSNNQGLVASSSSQSSLDLREQWNKPSAALMAEPEFDNGNLRQRRVELLDYFENDLLQELLRECTRDQIHTKLNDSKTAKKMLQGEFYRKVDYDGLVEFIRCTDLNYPLFENDRNDIEYDHNSKSKHRKRIWELISKLIETHGSTLTPARLLNAAKDYEKQIYYDNFYEAFKKKFETRGLSIKIKLVSYQFTKC